ncbi:ABC transporter substrate-binding protein [Bacilliculturomica massiliensis]|uniref:ABC transporter substrate-binding protein n=1 Tax=Bacilliculturomica massiliensis TaxID=1917867 RepID=UPI001030541F|nr:extracellular solute-binding protein [Bacilliculturomica massiliensis]
MKNEWQAGWKRGIAAALCGLMIFALGACGSDSGESGGTQEGKEFAGEEIAVLLPPWYEEGIAATIPEFEEATGIKVNLEILDWDPLRDRIVTACSSGKAPADVTEFSWDWVGNFGAAGWYAPLNDSLDDAFWADSMTKDTFKYGEDYLAVPIYNDFRLTYVNKADFTAAGIEAVPAGADEILEAARKIKASGVEEYPVALPLSAVAATTTPWFMLTKSYGGELFDENYQPLFLEKDSAGYRAMNWIMTGLSEGLIDPASLDYQGMDVVDRFKLGQGSIDIAGWAGNVTEYFNSEKSQISDSVEVIKVPGAEGVSRTYGLLEGVGIPAASEHKGAAAEFIKWINRPEFVESFFVDYGIFPSSQAVIDKLVGEGKIPGGEVVSEVLGTIEPLFPQGAPEWYGNWESETAAVMNQMAKGQLSLDAGLAAIADAAAKLQK